MTSLCSILLLLLCLTFSTQGQIPLYKAEGLFLVDDETVQEYMRDITNITNNILKREKAILELQRDINYTLSELNKLIWTLTASRVINITLYVRKIEVLSRDTFQYPPLVAGTVNGFDCDAFLEKLQYFLLSYNYYDTYTFDFAILWTGFDLHKNNVNNPEGCAYVGKICDSQQAIGVVKFSRTYRTVMVTAHEIGHILGSVHGGPASKNIMAVNIPTSSTKRWLFSHCSATDIKEYVDTLQDNCLLNTSNASYQVTVNPTSYQGLILNVDDICRRSLKNVNAYMTREWMWYNNVPPNGDNVCSTILCAKPETRNVRIRSVKNVLPSDGMVCNVSKGCSKGRCILNRGTKANITSDCLYGNQPVIEIPIFSGSCEEFLNNHGSFQCHMDQVNQACCASCKARYTGITGCEYGDTSLNCTLDTREVICPLSMQVCCYYCRDFVVSNKRSYELLNEKPLKQIPRFEMSEEDYKFNYTVISDENNLNDWKEV